MNPPETSCRNEDFYRKFEAFSELQPIETEMNGYLNALCQENFKGKRKVRGGGGGGGGYYEHVSNVLNREFKSMLMWRNLIKAIDIYEFEGNIINPAPKRQRRSYQSYNYFEEDGDLDLDADNHLIGVPMNLDIEKNLTEQHHSFHYGERRVPKMVSSDHYSKSNEVVEKITSSSSSARKLNLNNLNDGETNTGTIITNVKNDSMMDISPQKTSSSSHHHVDHQPELDLTNSPKIPAIQPSKITQPPPTTIPPLNASSVVINPIPPIVSLIPPVRPSSSSAVVPPIKEKDIPPPSHVSEVKVVPQKKLVEPIVPEKPKYIVSGEGFFGNKFEFPQMDNTKPFIIGRKIADINLDLAAYTEIRTISHRHCAIVYDPKTSTYILESYGRNGTRHNGQVFGKDQHDAKRVLSSGDKIEVGKVIIHFQIPN
eukprot:TRINITY_DN4435_c0_g1_i2.p1 TRINITY_DN4435_c0_g1~~TRINITY_DN4435_c0_g1_i2.p1  ORF type:complete len:445 (+),score=121.56 TRINITY_DN4435_c0_g1_i2:56-1336(+)